MLTFIVCDISALCVLLLATSAINIIFVLWTGNAAVGHCLVLLCTVIPAVFHIDRFH
jgi:hypothetical protein